MSFISENLDWMYWTPPSAIVFTTLFATIIGMGIWDHFSPSPNRKGFLPIPTTRGDRLFIGILTTIAIFLAWLALAGNSALWIPLAGAALAFALIGRWG